MRATRIPGPVCVLGWNVDIDDGTLSRWPMAYGVKRDPMEPPFLYRETFTTTDSRPLNPVPELGSLSARYESNGSAAAIGCDSTGGWSYGAYQIATKTHTFKYFLQYLIVHNADLAQALEDAGGNKGATKGTVKFRREWRSLAKHQALAFMSAQHEFIKSTHYDRQVENLIEDYALDVNRRSRALQNVVWSMAVQHGDGTETIFENVLRAQPKGTKLSAISDADLIHLLYAERSKVDKYFAHSKKSVKASVKKRFAQEEKQAIEMLKKEGVDPSKSNNRRLP